MQSLFHKRGSERDDEANVIEHHAPPCSQTSWQNREAQKTQRAMAAARGPLCGQIYNIDWSCVHRWPVIGQDFTRITRDMQKHTNQASALANNLEPPAASLVGD